MARVRPWVPVARPDTVLGARAPWGRVVRVRWDPVDPAVHVRPWVLVVRAAHGRRWDPVVTAPARVARAPILPARVDPVRWGRVAPVVRVPRWDPEAQVDPVRWVPADPVVMAPVARARWALGVRVRVARAVPVRWDLVVPAVRAPVVLVPDQVPVRGARELPDALPACR